MERDSQGGFDEGVAFVLITGVVYQLGLVPLTLEKKLRLWEGGSRANSISPNDEKSSGAC